MVKNPPVNAGDARDMGSIPGSGSSPRVGTGNPLQYSHLENPMDRGAWSATVRHCQKQLDRTEPAHTHTHHRGKVFHHSPMLKDGNFLQIGL